MKKMFKKCAARALSLTVAAVTALSVGLNAAASAATSDDYPAKSENAGLAFSQVEKTYDRAIADTMSNDWMFLVVFFKSVDATVDLNGKTIHTKKTISDAEIEKIKSDVINRMPYQFLQDTHGKAGIDAIDYVYVDEPLTNKDLELGISPADYRKERKGYRADVYNSELVRGVLDKCLEQNHYSQIMIFTPLGEISPEVAGWCGSKYGDVHIAQIIMRDDIYSYYETILHEICHGPETDSKAMNNNRTIDLHEMYNYGMWEYDWYEYYMNDMLPDGKKGVEPMAFYRLRSDYTPLTGGMTLTAPTNLAAKANSDTAATLSWDKSSTGNGYQVCVFKNADHSEMLNTYVKMSNETSLELTGLVKGNTYYYGVRTAMTADGKTYYSDWTYLKYTHRGVSEASGGLRITKTSDRYFTFNWDAVPNASGYQLAQLDAKFRTYGQDIYDYNADTLSVVLGPYTNYKTYYFGIRSYQMVAGEKVWPDWTYLTFEYGDDPVVYGDVNDDGAFNMADVTAALRMCVNETALDVRTCRALDIKGRALLSMSDVAALLQAYVNS